MKSYFNGFIAFTPVQLAVIATLAGLSIYTSGLAGGMQLTLIFLTLHLSWALLRFSHERKTWNQGQSEFGCRWQYRGLNFLLGHKYQEKITSAPRAGDVLHLFHYNPSQNRLRLI